jgi:UDP-N-acetylglucosamine--N-acetylmuramyl-(pentapeptide) pyrophosphoryl-undecaprenol N-acetylglucosamine transferase
VSRPLTRPAETAPPAAPARGDAWSGSGSAAWGDNAGAAPRLLLATGGSGGHVFPAIALAGAARGRGAEVLVLGTEDGMEARLVPAAGLPFIGVRAGKFDRQRPDPRAPLRALLGLLQARGALRRWRPHLVVGFGGYASFPGSAAAVLTRTPLVLHETNAYPGLVTRALGRRARLVVVCQRETAERLHGAASALVPFPVREQRTPRDAARRALGIPEDALLTLVMGGSQGSLALNRALPRIAAEVAASDPRAWVLHATGPRWLESVRAEVGGRERYRVEGFVDAGLAWSAADLAITRGGYGTLAEAAFHAVPLVVVPLPSAADDHQRHNAEALARAGGGAWVRQGDDAALAAAWRRLLDDEQRTAASAAQAARSPAGGTTQLLEAVWPLLTDSRKAGE